MSNEPLDVADSQQYLSNIYRFNHLEKKSLFLWLEKYLILTISSNVFDRISQL